MSGLKKLIRFFMGQVGAKIMRRKLLLIYMRALQAARRSLLAAFVIYFILQLMILGFLGAVVSGLWILPLDESTRLYSIFGFCAALFILPAIGLAFAFSERFWFEASGAKKLMDD
jgi:hypothetical protein